MRRFDEEWELLIAARTWLNEAGYLLVESRGPEGMDQAIDIYRGSAIGIRLVADRSQWFVDVRPTTPDGDWFNLECWSTCLGVPVLFHDAKPRISEQDWSDVIANSWWLRPQLDYLRHHLRSIEGSCEPTRVAGTLDCLAKARLGATAFLP